MDEVGAVSEPETKPAPEAPPPTELSERDRYAWKFHVERCRRLRVQVDFHTSNLQYVQAELAQANREAHAEQERIVEAYKVTPVDNIDFETGAIRRRPRAVPPQKEE